MRHHNSCLAARSPAADDKPNCLHKLCPAVFVADARWPFGTKGKRITSRSGSTSGLSRRCKSASPEITSFHLSDSLGAVRLARASAAAQPPPYLRATVSRNNFHRARPLSGELRRRRRRHSPPARGAQRRKPFTNLAHRYADNLCAGRPARRAHLSARHSWPVMPSRVRPLARRHAPRAGRSAGRQPKSSRQARQQSRQTAGRRRSGNLSAAG